MHVQIAFSSDRPSWKDLSVKGVQTRGIVKTSGFTRGVCKIGDFIRFEGFRVEFLENRRS